MKLWVAQYLMKRRMPIETFMRMAYLWKYGKEIDEKELAVDANAFRYTCYVPAYVEHYVDGHLHLKEKEHESNTG